jgi:hypothetical protein
MAYELSWYAPDKVLLLTLSGDYTLQDASQVDEQIVEALDQSPVPLLLVIDARNMMRPHNFQELRGAQSYMHHDNLRRIVSVADDRIVMLAMIAIFNLGRAALMMFNDFHKANTFLDREVARI